MSKVFERRALDKLRKAAEAELERRPQLIAELPRPAEELLHELHVHQIELEMQNEMLRKTQLELEESRNRYLDLYDFAPVGLLILTTDAVIVEINFAAAFMLGMERTELAGSRFEQWITSEARERWSRYFLDVLNTDGTHHCELSFQRGDGSSIYAALGCQRIETDDKPRVVRVAFSDITEHKQTESELREYQSLMRELASHAVASREAEYKHIAREVHDELGQLLTALRMDISLLRIQYGERDPALLKKIVEMLALVDKIIAGARNVVANLRPRAIDMGVISAIQWLCDNFPGRGNTACTVKAAATLELSDAHTIAIFRIVQESLTNVARYAEANSVEISVRQQGEDVEVEVRDDGKGFDPAGLPVSKSFGLIGMRERALAVGGTVEIDSAPSRGTVVSIRVPNKPVRGNS